MSITKEIELMREKIAAQDKDLQLLHDVSCESAEAQGALLNAISLMAEQISELKRHVVSAKLANRMLDESGVDFLKEQAV
jgi:hypothetical protein